MLYYLFTYLHEAYDLPGAGLFQYISFRASMAAVLALIIGTVFGKRIIAYLQMKQIGEIVRDLGLEGQYQKKGTPTMGGVIILISILIPTFLFAKLDNIYVLLMIITTVWLGFIGFMDDYIKVFKKNKDGLRGKYKVLGQVTLGIIIGSAIYLSNDVVIRKNIEVQQANGQVEVIKQDVPSTETTIPFLKDNTLDYAWFVKFLGENYKSWAWLIFIPIVIFIITAVSNGANLTDGLDGLATGTSAIIGITLGLLAYVSGNVVFADYLDIMYIPNSGELVIFISAFTGALIGFLWYNTFPAQVFMGDTGSLTIGGIIAAFAILIRKELLLPILAGIFLVENLSVVLQVSYFKYTKKKYGEGRRIFKMSPLHHHYQKLGYAEPKIVARFIIVGIVLAIMTIMTLKLR